jgi:hypothetical protein
MEDGRNNKSVRIWLQVQILPSLYVYLITGLLSNFKLIRDEQH